MSGRAGKGGVEAKLNMGVQAPHVLAQHPVAPIRRDINQLHQNKSASLPGVVRMLQEGRGIGRVTGIC